MNYYLDLETRSPADIKKVGGHAYAAHPETEILLVSIATDERGPLLFSPIGQDAGIPDEEDAAAREIWDWMITTEDPVWAFNAGGFEIPVMGALTTEVDLFRWRDAAVIARMLGVRSSLSMAAVDLGLPEAKSPDGWLINRFCVPPYKVPDEATGISGTKAQAEEWSLWLRFLEYARQDTETLRTMIHSIGIDNAERLWKHVGQAFIDDVLVEARGVPVHLPTVAVAQKVLAREEEALSAEFQEITGLKPSQRQAVLEWAQERGYYFDNLQAETVDTFLAGKVSDPSLREAMELRRAVTFAATSKLDVMEAASLNGRVRGAHIFHGATMTGRWSGALLQMQNFKRPEFKDTALVVDLLERGIDDPEPYALLWGSASRAIASSIRHFIREPDRPLLQCDYSAVEARILVWLAGQEDILDRYRDPEFDAYLDMAAVIGGGATRQLGKQAVLGCGYQMGPPRFKDTCAAYGIEVDDDLAQRAVYAYRDRYHRVRTLWQRVQSAALRAVQNPGKRVKVDHLAFAGGKVAGIPVLVLTLPSGRPLIYPHVEVADSERFEGELEIRYWGRALSGGWAMVNTYGGKLVENATQAVAADLMMAAVRNCHVEDIMPVGLVHDEILARPLHSRDPESYERQFQALQAAMLDAPPWAKDIPLAAEGGVVPYYIKS